MTKIILRKTEDLDLIQDLHKTIFTTDPKVDGDELENSEWWVARCEGEPVGFCGMDVEARIDLSYPYDDVYEAVFVRAGVLPEFRGSGLQKRMIRTRLQEAKRLKCRRVHTYTWVGSIPSMRSLLACGFKPYKYVWDDTQNQTFLHFERYL